MFNNARALIEFCRLDIHPNMSVIADYFGRCMSEEEIAIVFKIYKELVNVKGVDQNLLHTCFLSNRLNDLVHIKNAYDPTDSYVQFRMLNIDLTPWRYVDAIAEEQWLEILTDDHCINCEIDGFFTDNNKSDIDCYCCGKPLCCFCISDSEPEFCINCHN